jgi:hypothetical protein
MEQVWLDFIYGEINWPERRGFKADGEEEWKEAHVDVVIGAHGDVSDREGGRWRISS